MTPSSHPRGVTLVELLAAISIVVVVTALSLPAVQGRLSAARMEAAQGQLEAAAIATRAEAVRRGKTLELVARAGREGMELVVNVVERERIQASAEGEEGPGREARREEREAKPGELWCELPGGIEMAARAREEGAEAKDVRIALFFPDGSALGGGSCFLRDKSDEFVVSVSSLVGGVSFAPYVKEEEAEEERAGGATGDERPAATGSPG